MFFEDIFIDLNNFTKTDQILGTGSYSTVYEIRDNSTQEKYAAKVLNPNMFLKKDDQKQLMRQITNISRLHHIAILQFKGFNFRSFQDIDKFLPTIITEYVDNISLKELFAKIKDKNTPDGWTESKQILVLLGLSNAFQYLHQNNIMHLNLKSENVLLDKDFHPHLTGFSQSRNLPESIISNSHQSPLIIGFKVDVFSFGLLALEIVAKTRPSDAKKQISKGKLIFPNEVSQNLKTLIHQCLDSDPNKRPSFEDIFNRLLAEQISMENPEVLEYVENLINNVSRLSSDDLNYEKEIVQTFDTIIQNGMFERIFLKGLFYNESLFHACKNGDTKIVKVLLSRNDININARFVFNFEYFKITF